MVASYKSKEPSVTAPIAGMTYEESRKGVSKGQNGEEVGYRYAQCGIFYFRTRSRVEGKSGLFSGCFASVHNGCEPK